MVSCRTVGQLLRVSSSVVTEANWDSASRVGKCTSDLSGAFPSDPISSSLGDGTRAEINAGKGLEGAEEEEDAEEEEEWGDNPAFTGEREPA